MQPSDDQLIKTARKILLQNRKGGFTVPTPKLYPFQWNWDSGFCCLGLMHFDLDLAIEELQTLFGGQWVNGMIPHILFHSENESSYFPNHDFWTPEVNPGAPQKPRTSGITQPPVHAFVLEWMWQKYPGSQALSECVRELYPKLLASHRFFYTIRDPKREGLAFIYHPWESGRDNSPLWDGSMDRIVIEPGSIPSYQRKDTDHADAAERPTSAQYDRYVYLLELGKKHQYDGPGIFENSPFLIQDTMLNAILIRSNEGLIRLGKAFGFDTREPEDWQSRSVPAFQKLWNESLQCFCSYDLVAEKQIAMKEIGGLVSLFAGVANKRQIEAQADYLKKLYQYDFYLCPSFDPQEALFDSRRYWRGPVWPQMEWLLIQGLFRNKENNMADQVKKDFFDLIRQFGFFEYFEAQKDKALHLDKGYGGNHFSWTAACFIDLMHTK